jgi:hypothetical protein
VSLGSTVTQLRHFPVGPWLHLPSGLPEEEASLGLGPDFPTVRQLRHLPPSGWLHRKAVSSFLYVSIITLGQR